MGGSLLSKAEVPGSSLLGHLPKEFSLRLTWYPWLVGYYLLMLFKSAREGATWVFHNCHTGHVLRQQVAKDRYLSEEVIGLKTSLLRQQAVKVMYLSKEIMDLKTSLEKHQTAKVRYLSEEVKDLKTSLPRQQVAKDKYLDGIQRL